MLLFKQLDFFAQIAGEAVGFPRRRTKRHGKLAASPAGSATPSDKSRRDLELEKTAREILECVGATAMAALVRVEWNSRLRSAAGRASFQQTLVSLNPRLREHGDAEIDRTLRHELAHLVAHFHVKRRRIAPHGAEWRQACRDLGIADEARCHTLPFPTQQRARRLLYRCPRCAQDFPRVRRMRRGVACLACCRRHNRGRYDRRYQLQLVHAKSDSKLSRV